MPEYKLKFTEENESPDEGRQETLNELQAFMHDMEGRAMAVITLDPEQSANWDTEGDIDYPQEYGQQIIWQLSADPEEEAETLVIRNHDELPVALGVVDHEGKWQGIGIDKRLRQEISDMMELDNDDLE
jgi:hypothetical protein